MYKSKEHPRDGVVVRRTVRILRVIEGFGGDWFGMMMIVKQTGIPKGTVHRYLALFVQEGVLERHLHLHTYREIPEVQKVLR